MRTSLFASTVMVCSVLAAAPARGDALPQTVAERIRPVVPAAIEYYNERSEDPLPAVSAKQVQKLLEGEVVGIRRRRPGDVEDPPERITGYRIVPLPRAQVWVAAMDPDFQASSLLTEHRLGPDETGSSLWHQYLSLPWPVSDRQWVIRVGLRTLLAAETGGLVWEEFWELAPAGEEVAAASIDAGNLDQITVESAEGAIYVSANEGSWVMFQLEDNLTLVGYRIIARVGGSIPDSWIASFGLSQLSEVLDAVAKHAVEIPELYDPARHPIAGGDGETLERF